MTNKPPPFQGPDTRIPNIIPIKERGFINHGSGSTGISAFSWMTRCCTCVPHGPLQCRCLCHLPVVRVGFRFLGLGFRGQDMRNPLCWDHGRVVSSSGIGSPFLCSDGLVLTWGYWLSLTHIPLSTYPPNPPDKRCAIPVLFYSQGTVHKEAGRFIIRGGDWYLANLRHEVKVGFERFRFHS